MRRSDDRTWTRVSLAVVSTTLVLGCASTPHAQQNVLTIDPTGALKSEPDESGYCTYLDGQRRKFGWIAAGSAVLAGGGAAVSTAIQNQGDVGRATLSGTFLALGALAALSAYLTSDYAQTSKAHGCITGAPTGAVPKK